MQEIPGINKDLAVNYIFYGILAQSVEHMTFNHGVPGSNPGYLIDLEIYNCESADVAELADAPDLGSGSREWGFKSLHPHQCGCSYSN